MLRPTAISQLPGHHFYGYCGSNPYDAAMRHYLAVESDFNDREPTPEDRARVGLIDLETGIFEAYGETAAFNFQFGSMMRWINVLGKEEFYYHDWVDGTLRTRVVDPKTRETRLLSKAVAALSPAEPKGMALSYNRMYFCRRVVGYPNVCETFDLYPEDDGIFAVDLVTGESQLIVSIAQVVRALGHDLPQGWRFWFNHIDYSTDGRRILFLARMTQDTDKPFHTSLWTISADGTGLSLLLDMTDRGISHLAWLNERQIVVTTGAFDEGEMVCKLVDYEEKVFTTWTDRFERDAHLSFSPDRRYLVFDYYPQPQKGYHFRELFLLDIEKDVRYTLGAFYADPHFFHPYNSNIRCDLHARWRPDGLAVSFDSIHEGSRQIYEIDVSAIVAPPKTGKASAVRLLTPDIPR